MTASHVTSGDSRAPTVSTTWRWKPSLRSRSATMAPVSSRAGFNGQSLSGGPCCFRDREPPSETVPSPQSFEVPRHGRHQEPEGLPARPGKDSTRALDLGVAVGAVSRNQAWLARLPSYVELYYKPKIVGQPYGVTNIS